MREVRTQAPSPSLLGNALAEVSIAVCIKRCALPHSVSCKVQARVDEARRTCAVCTIVWVLSRLAPCLRCLRMLAHGLVSVFTTMTNRDALQRPQFWNAY